jgi:6-pyruvoyltetrahydropterin/6-carboxytetrahydropterin synthase
MTNSSGNSAPTALSRSRADAAASIPTAAFTIAKSFPISVSHWVLVANDRRWCGHNLDVALVLTADQLDQVGMVWDYGQLDPMKDLLKRTVDHRHLDDVVGGPPAPCDQARLQLSGFVYSQLVSDPDLPFRSLVHDVRVADDAGPDGLPLAWQGVPGPWQFNAAHRLAGLPEGHQCGRWHGHGYRWGVQVGQGHARDVAAASRILRPAKAFVRAQLHQHPLNEALGGLNPTAEQAARFLYHQFTENLGIRGITRVLIAETPKTLAEYRP